ncbi:unnamed protein product, partial [Onchocerca ochengi]
YISINWKSMAALKLPNTPEIVRNFIHIKSKLIRNALAECVGTFILLFIGTSIIAQLHLSHGTINSWVQINVGWGFAITISVTSVSHLSGGHLNPAISALFLSMGMLDIVSFVVYIIFQHIGAFLGAAATYAVYVVIYQ